MITYLNQAVPVFSIPPNWKRPPRISEAWGGAIREAISTAEDRQGNRHRPTYKIAYDTLSLTAQEQGFIRKVLEQSGALPIAVGFWPFACKLTAPAVAGTPYVTVDNADDGLFDVLPYVMVWDAFNNFETKRIALFNTTQIQFVEPLEADRAVDTWVIPMTVGKVLRSDTKALTDAHGIFKLNFEEAFFSDGVFTGRTLIGEEQYGLLATEFIGIGGPLL